MSKPRVFLSSTYLDLAIIRNSVYNWLKEDMGYYAIAFEKGGVFFNPFYEIDKSCYNEVKKCHFLISIIGSRYGSPASNEKNC